MSLPLYDCPNAPPAHSPVPRATWLRSSRLGARLSVTNPQGTVAFIAILVSIVISTSIPSSPSRTIRGASDCLSVLSASKVGADLLFDDDVDLEADSSPGRQIRWPGSDLAKLGSLWRSWLVPAPITDGGPIIGWRDRARLLSWWYQLEAPLRGVRLPGSSADAIRIDKVRSAIKSSASAQRASRRLQIKLDALCDTFAALGVPGLPDECPEALVLDKNLAEGRRATVRDKWSASTVYSKVWSARDRRRAQLPAQSKSQRQRQRNAVIVVQRELLRSLKDSELNALLGLHLGRVMLSPQLPAVWNWGKLLFGVRVYMYKALISSFQQQVEDQQLKKAKRRRPTRGAAPAEANKFQLESWAGGVMLDAAVAHVVGNVLAHRTDELLKASDRLAVIAGGSVEAASVAFAIDSKDSVNRVYEVEEWAETNLGHQLLLESKVLLKRARRERLFSTAADGEGADLAGGVPWVDEIAIWRTTFVGLMFAFVLACLLVFVDSTIVATGLCVLAMVHAAVVVATAAASSQAEVPNDMSFGLCLYMFALGCIWCRCRQTWCARSGHATVTSLVKEALPAATEAAAGVALMARCSLIAREWTLGALDRELNQRWTSSLRGLSAKLADLRRLAEAEDAEAFTSSLPPFGQAHLGNRGWGPSRDSAGAASSLCAKLESDVRQVLAAELHWMRQSLEVDIDESLVRSIFWWLHDDQECDAWGGPRARDEVLGATGGETLLEKMAYPSLNSAINACANTDDVVKRMDTQDLHHAATALAEQHRGLDELQQALHKQSQEDPRGYGCGDGCVGFWRRAWVLLVRRLGDGLRTLTFGAGVASSDGTGDAEASIRSFVDQCELLLPQGAASSSKAASSSGHSVCNRCWEFALPLVFAASVLAICCAKMLWIERALHLLIDLMLLHALQELRLPFLYARLESCLQHLALERDRLVMFVQLASRPRIERLAHLKALVVMQGVRTAQNLDHIALCVQTEALHCAANTGRSSRLEFGRLEDRSAQRPRCIHQCLQLLYALVPRQGRRGLRLVSNDRDILQAMAWFAAPLRFPSPDAATVALATSQRQLWMLVRLADIRAASRPTGGQNALSALLDGQLWPIVRERRLRLPGLHPMAPSSSSTSLTGARGAAASAASGSGKSDDSQGRILGEVDSTAGSHVDESDASSVGSGTVRRILAASEAVSLRSGSRQSDRASSRNSRHSDRASGLLQEACDGSSEDAESESVISSVEPDGDDGGNRILAASDASDGASSDSASSAGFQSFGIGKSMWSGMSRSAHSSTSSLTDDILMHRRPLLEGYASALRPLFMTRGDLIHLLSKFPAKVLIGGPTASAKSFAAHRELLEELFGSLIVAVKSPERRGKIKLAFCESFSYRREPYELGHLKTNLHIVSHAVRRSGNEQIPVVYEEENEDEERSEAAVSMARDDVSNVGGQQGVLEFEELVVPLTEVSSRELFLAELMQSDQCQLLASLSQGSHSKYSHRALRRRRRTLRHVREATQLLANVPGE